MSSATASQETYWPWAVPTRPVGARDGYVRGHDPATVASGRARAQEPDYPA